MDVGAEDFEAEWAGLWDDPLFPLHVVAERRGGSWAMRSSTHVRPATSASQGPTSTWRTPQRSRASEGSGVGLALTSEVLTWAHEQGYESMTTDWRSVNLLASRFWPKRGWRPTHYRMYRSVALRSRDPHLFAPVARG